MPPRVTGVVLHGGRALGVKEGCGQSVVVAITAVVSIKKKFLPTD